MNYLLPAAAAVLRAAIYGDAGEWARANRMLRSSESSEPGPFNPDRTPYFREIYRACASGRYRAVCVVCASQMAKTEFELNVLGHSFDTRPGPCMLALPNKDLAKRFSKARVAKLLRNTPSLWSKLAKGNLDNVFEKYIAGSQLKLAWTTSATQLCSDPAKLVILDELDRMPDDVEGEGDPVSLANARGSTFPDFLMVACSTPTVENDSKIMGLYALGTEQTFRLPCRHCGHYFAPFFSHLRVPKEGENAEAAVICPECDGVLDDGWRRTLGRGLYLGPDQKVENGRVVGPLKNTGTASFWIPGLLSPWVSFAESTAMWLDASRSNDSAKIKAVINTRFGETYRTVGERPNQEEMDPLRSAPASPFLPGWALLLTAGVDVQKRGLYAVVRAWGAEGKSQCVLFAFLPGDTLEDQVWKDLESRILKYPFETAEKQPRKLSVAKAAIDRRYREEMVDVFVSRRKDQCYGAVGQFRQAMPVRLQKMEVTYEGRPKMAGIQVLSCNDTHFKLSVFNRITRGPDVEDAWLISEDATQEYCDQVLSEELLTLPSGKAVWTVKNKQNHALDCEKFNLALAHFLNLRLLKDSAPETGDRKRKTGQAREFVEA